MKKPSNLRIFIDGNRYVHFLVVRLLRWQGKHSPCIFCKIVSGAAPERVLYQDEMVTAFRDAYPAAPVHILVVSNRHIASLNDLEIGDAPLAGHLFLVALRVACQENLLSNGYRMTINTGLYAGQTVFHLHLHLMSGDLKRG